MTLEELKSWDFIPPLVEGGQIFCFHCKQWSVHSDWKEGESFCEDCGEHSAIFCPECYTYYDYVWDTGIPTRIL